MNSWDRQAIQKALIDPLKALSTVPDDWTIEYPHGRIVHAHEGVYIIDWLWIHSTHLLLDRYPTHVHPVIHNANSIWEKLLILDFPVQILESFVAATLHTAKELMPHPSRDPDTQPPRASRAHEFRFYLLWEILRRIPNEEFDTPN